MKIGICSSVLNCLGDVNERYKRASEMGYTAIDLNMGEKWSVGQIYKKENFGFFDKSVDEIIEYFSQHSSAAKLNGIEVFQAHAPFPSARMGLDEMNAYTRMTFEKCVLAAEAIGCPNLVVHPIHVGEHISDDEAFEVNFEHFKGFSELLVRTGVTMCIENAYYYVNGRINCASESNAEFLIRLVDALNAFAGSECFAICYDTGHGNITGKDHYRELLVYGKHLRTLHIHDTDGVHDTHLIPYTGRYLDRQATDWTGILKGLAKIGYDGCLSFESDSGILGMPEDVRPAAINLNASIGKFFDRKIKEYKESNS